MKTSARIAATALTAAAFMVLTAVPSWAEAPSTWDEGKGRSVLENIIFFGGWTAGLWIGVALFAIVISRKNFTPGD